MLKKNERIICPDKSVKFVISKLNPINWLINNIEGETSKYAVFEVDGYIIDKDNLPKANFTRFEVTDDNIDTLQIEILIDEIKANFKTKLLYNLKFAKLLEIKHWVIITLNNYPLGYDLSYKGIISLDFDLTENDEFILKSVKYLDANEMEIGIKKLRGFSFKNVKELLTGPNQLSCYLNNKTTNPFPGDLDAIIFDKQLNEVISLIEFKTHNIDSPIENEHIGKYGVQDWRRFEVIFNLKKFIESKQSKQAKLFYFAWGTKNIDNHKNIKIDLLENKKIVSTQILKRPEFDIYSNEVLEKLI
jgi:hypothetical protein